LQYYLAALGSWYLMLLGVLAIVLMLFAPAGVWGVVSRYFNITLFPVRRRLIGKTFGLTIAGTADHNGQPVASTLGPIDPVRLAQGTSLA